MNERQDMNEYMKDMWGKINNMTEMMQLVTEQELKNVCFPLPLQKID
jgi:hypothetical protein